jgi:hypothetical protein
MATNVEYVLSLKDQFSSKIDNANKSVNKLESNVSSLKGGMKSMLSGFAMGVGIGAFEALSEAVVSFGQNAIKEFEEATRISNELQRTLKTVGRESYYDSLINESNDLAKTFKNLFDNDDIVVAQTKLINYGKLTRSEMSALIPIIADLSAKEGIDLAQATESVINIMAGRGGATLRQYGLTVKGTSTEHERLNLILGDFQNKLKGSVETYALSAQGIQQTNKVLLANIEENFGQSFANIKMKVLPVITSLLNGMNLLLASKSEYEKIRGGIIANQKGDQITGLLNISEKRYSDARKKGLITEKQEREATIKYYNQKELDLVNSYNRDQATLKKATDPAFNSDNINVKELSDNLAEYGNQLDIVRKRRTSYVETTKKDFSTAFNPNADAGAGLVTPPATKTALSKTPKNSAISSNTSRSQATGSKAVTINVSIKDLIGVNNMNITNVKDGANKIKDMVVSALTGAVNDFQIIAE